MLRSQRFLVVVPTFASRITDPISHLPRGAGLA
jgi:hypothetical protein